MQTRRRPPTRHVRHDPGRRRQHGQVIVLFALMLASLIGMLGLSIDLGFNFVQRRALQNAADAAVTVALNDIQASAPSGTPNNVAADVNSILAANGFPLASSTSSTSDCEFLNNVGSGSYSPPQPCSANQVPLDASGVRVTLIEAYHTFFMPVLGISASTISAAAAGHIELPTLDSGQMPFILCGDSARINDGNGDTAFIYATVPSAANGAPTEVFPPSIPSPALAPSLYTDQFLIYAPNGGNSGKGISRCGLGDSSFKGTNAASGGPSQPVNLDPAAWFSGATGKRTGPTITRVTNGCANNSLTNCRVIVPIAENNDNPPVDANGQNPGIRCTGPAPSNGLCVDMYVVMQINPTGNSGKNFEGQLVNPQPNIEADGSLSWTVGSGGGSGPVTLRLTQ